MELPDDPVMLMSVINTWLRDRYPDFEALCDDIGVDPDTLIEKLKGAGFEYMPQINQFR